MVNLMNKTRGWFAASVLAVTTAFAETNDVSPPIPATSRRGHEMSKDLMMPIYNAPARIDVRSSWDLYVTGRFLYWQAREENLEIGFISHNDPEGLINGPTTPFGNSFVNNIKVVDQQFTFRPGFKIGLGMNLDNDNWDAFMEYTWFHSNTTGRVNPLARNTATVVPPNGEYLYPAQGAPAAMESLLFFPFFFQSATQSWHLKMDFFDVSLARNYYSGTKLTLRPYFGARGAWIRQHLNTVMNGNTQYAVRYGFDDAVLHNSSVSWGVGPRAGFEGNWLLGQGVRLIGNGSSDILYTRYSLRSNEQYADQAASSNPIDTNASVSQEIDYLRTHAELELGFGWGSYFDNNKWHIDLAATYGFQIFWDQNMFRNFENRTMETKSFSPNGNLYIHGMTLSANLDF